MHSDCAFASSFGDRYEARYLLVFIEMLDFVMWLKRNENADMD